MYESKIFVQCVIQSGADSTAPEWEEDGQLASPGPAFLQEASKPQPCVRSADVPLLRSLPQRQLLTNIVGLWHNHNLSLGLLKGRGQVTGWFFNTSLFPVCFTLSQAPNEQVWILSCSVMSNSLRPRELQPARLRCPWDSPGKNTGVGWHFLLHGIFPIQGSNPCLLHLLPRQADSLLLSDLGILLFS